MMEDEDLSKYVIMEEVGVKKSRKYGLTFKTWDCTVSEELLKREFTDFPALIESILEHLLKTLLKDVGNRDKVRVRLYSKHLKQPIWTTPVEKDQLTVERIMAEVDKVLQSNTEFKLDDTFEISVQYTEIPEGSGRRPKPVQPKLLKKLRPDKRCLIEIKNRDNLCLARAIVTAKAFADNDPKYDCLRRQELSKGKNNEQTKRAKQLHEQAHVELRPCTLLDLPAFENVLPEYQFVVVGLEQLNSIIYKSPYKEKRILLLFHSGHFDVLTSLSAWFDKSYWCNYCMSPFEHIKDHRCENTCKACLRRTCAPSPGFFAECATCNRFDFASQDCFNFHKAKSEKRKRSLCERFFVCRDCHDFVADRRPTEPHECGEVRCPVCHKFSLPGTHACFIKPEVIDEKTLKKHDANKFMYLDFETFPGPDGNFIPNFACIQVVDGDKPVKTHTFPENLEELGRDISEDVYQFIFRKEHRGYFCLAHNLRGFDGYFVIKSLLEHGKVPDVIMNGSQLIEMREKEFGIKFRDTLNYVPFSLDSWAKSFDVAQKKGKFPHALNRPEFWNKVVEFPSAEAFGVASMGEKEKEEFLRWYEQYKAERNRLYDVTKELVEYCIQDVATLRCCSELLRELFKELSGGLCIFTSGLTIASVCHYFWRARLLQYGEVEVLQRPLRRENSVRGAKWIKYMQIVEGKPILPEFKYASYFLDGFHVESKTAYEFYGCIHHGHPDCTSSDTFHPKQDRTMSQLYAQTVAREAALKKMGIKFKTIWECKFDEQIAKDVQFRNAINGIEVRPRLDPRNALSGGRTNAMVLDYTIKEGERIFYLDVVSEYPFVNKTKRYPVGAHQAITEGFQSLENYFGLVFCKVLPPDSLNIPVLPTHTPKLTFTLCRTCAEMHSQVDCDHTDKERALTGTWCTVEVEEAVKQGYKILEIYEVWHYPETRERLFASYIDLFLALKVEASGWPSEVVSEEEKKSYVESFFATEGVRLNPEKIAKNPGLRQLAKLCLNSFWGRFGMRDNRLTTVFIDKAVEFYRYLTSTEYIVHDWVLFSDEILQLTYTQPAELVEINPKGNVVVAAITTAHARLHLLKFMQMVGDRLLYFDTDSIIFIQRPGDPPVPTGSTLGMLTSELERGEFIVHFCSTGPKSYSFITSNGICVCKMKGFTLTKIVKAILNFDVIRNLVRSKSGSAVAVFYPSNIRRVKRSFQIIDVAMTKKFRVTYDKRRVLDDFTTLPYGFRIRDV